jgi:glycosyltransferase involved in cell wall biosynthesis
MRIVVAHSHLNTLGGGERVALELLKRLGRQHELMLWAGRYSPSDTYEGFDAYPRQDIMPWQWLQRVPDADVVIAHTFGANLLAIRHPRTMCYVHTMRSVYLQRRDRPDLVARRGLDRLAMRRAAVLIANSQFTAESVAERYGRRPTVIYGGAADDVFAVASAPGDYLLYVGRLAPEKGLERLLEWSADLPADLVVVGSGTPDYERHLRRLAGARVRWLGPLRGEALARAYAGCRMLVFLPHEEELGLAVLEAMAAGRPVVAVPEGGIPELVQSGVQGMLVRDRAEYTRAVCDLLDDPTLATRMGLAGRERARRFTWDAMASDVARLCVDLMEGAVREAGAAGQTALK